MIPNKSSSSSPREEFFGPVSKPTGQYLKLPNDVKLELIDKDEDIGKLEILKTEKLIGVDSEWKPESDKNPSPKPSLLQLSGLKMAFLVDLVKLGNSGALDKVLCKIF